MKPPITTVSQFRFVALILQEKVKSLKYLSWERQDRIKLEAHSWFLWETIAVWHSHVVVTQNISALIVFQVYGMVGKRWLFVDNA